MRSRTVLLSVAILLPTLLVACSSTTTPSSAGESSSSAPASSEALVVETHNVVYQGIVQTNTVSVYMEGTHRLQLSTGGFILLSSETVDLNGYVGEEAEVTGSTRPTTEQGGTIMRVEKIQLLVEPLSSSSEASLISSESFAPTSSVQSQAPLVVSSVPTVASSKAPAVPSVTPPVIKPNPVSSSSVAAVSPVAGVPTESFLALVKKMAKEDFSDANWTQKYCTDHIGFCVPMHKYWYYVSFSANTTALWRVEASAAEINAVGDGPIVVNLLSGDISTTGATDGQVLSSGDKVVGFKAWTGNQHFEISAPASLKGAVDYMTAHLTATEKK